MQSLSIIWNGVSLCEYFLDCRRFSENLLRVGVVVVVVAGCSCWLFVVGCWLLAAVPVVVALALVGSATFDLEGLIYDTMSALLETKAMTLF